jgi:hypothetical protein
MVKAPLRGGLAQRYIHLHDLDPNVSRCPAPSRRATYICLDAAAWRGHLGGLAVWPVVCLLEFGFGFGFGAGRRGVSARAFAGSGKLL